MIESTSNPYSLLPIKGAYIKPKHWWGHAQFCLQEDLQYDICTVPRGFVSDGLSLSRWLAVIGALLMLTAFYKFSAAAWLGLVFVLAPVFFPRWGKTLRACILHDYLLKQRHIRWQFANKQFLRWLKLTRVSLWQRTIIFIAVTVYQAVKHVFKLITKRTLPWI